MEEIVSHGFLDQFTNVLKLLEVASKEGIDVVSAGRCVCTDNNHAYRSHKEVNLGLNLCQSSILKFAFGII